MITRTNFAKIDSEVKASIEEAFDYIKEHCKDYVLFLASGEYKEEYLKSSLRLNPHVIDDRTGRIKDESRLNFFISFMRQFYGFAKGVHQTTDEENKLHLELMIYTHIWESKPFLRQLFRMASLMNGAIYPWTVVIPESSRHEFIRDEIRDQFKKHELSIAKIMTLGFHTSLRNAFAHSEYEIYTNNRIIHLDTYKGAAWDIDRITFDDWTKRFCYSALLSYHLLNELHARKSSLIKDFGTDTFPIVHYFGSNKFRIENIIYDPKHDGFSFERNQRRR